MPWTLSPRPLTDVGIDAGINEGLVSAIGDKADATAEQPCGKHPEPSDPGLTVRIAGAINRAG